jgi:nucleotide-binding universal stress UspA family protein
MKKILVPVDFSNVTEVTLQVASRMAQALSAELTILHVAAPEPEFVGYEPGPASVRQSVAHQLTREHKQLQELKHQLEAKLGTVHTLAIQGYTVEKILAEAERMSADLIVMGSHGHGGLHHLLMGSVAEGVLRKTRCPVLLVPPAR